MLKRCGDVLVALLDRLVGLSARTSEDRFHPCSPKRRQFGRPTVPCHRRSVEVVAKRLQIEVITKPAAVDYPAELIEVGRLPVRSEAHDFVLVAILGKAEELRDSRVIDTKGMWERDF